jgi:hypothetical protein
MVGALLVHLLEIVPHARAMCIGVEGTSRSTGEPSQ